MEYVDASILIYALTDSTEKGVKARQLLLEKALLTNSLSLDEVGYYYFKESPQASARHLRAILTSPNLRFVPFAEEDFQEFVGLVEQGLAPRDAIHAATAVNNGCKVIYSEDKDFDSVKGLKRKTPW